MSVCTQKIVVEGATSVCGRPCEFRYPKRVRDLDPAKYSGTYKLCSAHRRLRRRYGEKSEACRRAITEKEEVK